MALSGEVHPYFDWSTHAQLMTTYTHPGVCKITLFRWNMKTGNLSLPYAYRLFVVSIYCLPKLFAKFRSWFLSVFSNIVCLIIHAVDFDYHTDCYIIYSGLGFIKLIPNVLVGLWAINVPVVREWTNFNSSPVYRVAQTSLEMHLRWSSKGVE